MKVVLITVMAITANAGIFTQRVNVEYKTKALYKAGDAVQLEFCLDPYVLFNDAHISRGFKFKPKYTYVKLIVPFGRDLKFVNVEFIADGDDQDLDVPSIDPAFLPKANREEISASKDLPEEESDKAPSEGFVAEDEEPEAGNQVAELTPPPKKAIQTPISESESQIDDFHDSLSQIDSENDDEVLEALEEMDDRSGSRNDSSDQDELKAKQVQSTVVESEQSPVTIAPKPVRKVDPANDWNALDFDVDLDNVPNSISGFKWFLNTMMGKDEREQLRLELKRKGYQNVDSMSPSQVIDALMHADKARLKKRSLDELVQDKNCWTAYFVLPKALAHSKRYRFQLHLKGTWVDIYKRSDTFEIKSHPDYESFWNRWFSGKSWSEWWRHL
jgi:hypothetical protein